MAPPMLAATLRVLARPVAAHVSPTRRSTYLVHPAMSFTAHGESRLSLIVAP